MVTTGEKEATWEKVDLLLEQTKSELSWMMERGCWNGNQWDDLTSAMEYLTLAQTILSRMNLS